MLSAWCNAASAEEKSCSTAQYFVFANGTSMHLPSSMASLATIRSNSASFVTKCAAIPDALNSVPRAVREARSTTSRIERWSNRQYPFRSLTAMNQNRRRRSSH